MPKRFKPLNNKEKLTIQLWLGVALVACGIALLWVGMFLVPIGEIHPSVLTAAGEVLTFSGALIGIDYSYKLKTLRYRDEEDEVEE